MELEVFTDVKKLPVGPIADTKSAEEEAELLEGLGFTKLAHAGVRDQKRSVRRALCKTAGMVPLAEWELTLWQNFLPTRYVDSQQPAFRTFSDYDFGSIPIEVLHLIGQCKKAELFDRLEIRTPETRVVDDPALFGAIGRDYYLLARWAESEFVSKKSMLHQARKNSFALNLHWASYLFNFFAFVAVIGAIGAFLGLGMLPKTLFVFIPMLVPFLILYLLGKTGLWWPISRLH